MMDDTNVSFLTGLNDYISGEEKKAEAPEKAPKNFRNDIVKDNYNDINDRDYGNNDIMAGAENSLHGTHVAGIIGAARNNGKGVEGIADNVKIMMIRAVPDGDEHDKDIALAIRYAVDNGAEIINLSLGGTNSSTILENAVNYAEEHDVTIYAAAGNYGAEGSLYPAAYDYVVSVGSLNKNLERSTFSNYGSRVEGRI